MNNLERFKAVVKFEKPDYTPIFGFSGSPGMAGGCMRKTYDRLVETGMPVDACPLYEEDGITFNLEKWYRYWGTTGPIENDIFPAEPGGAGIKSETRVEGEFEIIEYETGAVTRQVLNNDNTYSMPEFKVFHVRDRQSWNLYRERCTSGKLWSPDRIDEACKKFLKRDRPLCISLGTTWGGLRELAGPEMACTMLYDDPELAHEIIDWSAWVGRTYLFPLVERLKPEIVEMWEDISYKNGMLISPKQFREFGGSYYREIGELVKNNGVDMFSVDSDGNVMELAPLLEEFGVNAMHPFEVKAENDLFGLRSRHPKFIIMGGLEKEVINEGNGHLIREEIMSKVPGLLEKGGYFPNGDHGIQPLATFENLCRFMTLLHEVTGNPEGEFPRIK